MNSQPASVRMLPSRNPQVIFKPLPDSAVLLHTRSEVYFGLNAVGAQVWDLLPPNHSTFDELCSALAQKYPEVGAGDLRQDVEELLENLQQHGLVVAAEGEAG